MNTYEKMYGWMRRATPDTAETVDNLEAVNPHKLPPPTERTVDTLVEHGLPRHLADDLRENIARQQKEMAQQVARQRPSWDQTWMAVADTMALRATCPRLAVGVVAVRDNQLLVSAYNGAPRGLDHCVDVGCDVRGGHCVRVVHAEANAVAQAAYLGVSLKGATVYSRHGFCVRCANLLIQAGIREAVYVEAYNNGTDGAIEALVKSRVSVRQIA